MNSDNGQQRYDEDILRCKADILRLKGVVPPFGRPPKRDGASAADNVKISESTKENTPPSETSEKRTEPESESATDQLYNELQEPSLESQTEPSIQIPDIETGLQAEQDEITAPFDENPMAENILEEVIGSQEDDGQEAKLEIGGSHEEEEFTPASDSIPAAIEEDNILEENAAENKAEPEEDSEVPGFDLAQQIMAAQRKIAGNRRKGPGSPRFEIKEEKPKLAINTPAPQIFNSVNSTHAPMSPQQKVIAEIVARDISKHYKFHQKK